MNKQILPLVLALGLAQGVTAQSSFDAASQIAADHYMTVINQPTAVVGEPSNMPFTLNPLTRSEPEADVLIRLTPGTTVEDLESYGLDVYEVIGEVALASGRVSDIIALADTDLSVQISFSTPVKMMLDKARAASYVDEVHQGTDISQPYTGKGVITGIFDVGLDPNHINFFESDLTTNRIKRVWNYSTNGRVLSYETPSDIASFTTDDSGKTHGTHTLGCMAGSYTGNGSYMTATAIRVTQQNNKPMPFCGPSYESEIVAACGYNSINNIIQASLKIANYIEESGKPGVINLSFGNSSGPHDGSDNSAYAINEIAKRVPLFISAGNEGDVPFTIVDTFTADKTSVKTLVQPNSQTAEGSVEIWTADDKALTVRLFIYDRTLNQEIYSYSISGDQSGTLATSNYSATGYIKDDNIDKAFRSSTIAFSSKLSGTNNRWQIVANYNLKLASGNTTRRYVLGVAVEGKPGEHFDLLVKSDNSNLTAWDIDGFTNPSGDMSISNLACGKDVLSIGAYNTRYRWGVFGYSNSYSYDGADYNEGLLAPYSSYGVLYDGSTRPLVCAPGTGIISSVSRYYTNSVGGDQMSGRATIDGQTYYWEVEQGTSMSSPFAAGVGALWLQANPELTPADIREIIATTSYKDAKAAEETHHPHGWGYGKINALEGIKKAVTMTGISDVAVDAAEIMILGDGANGWHIVAPGAASVCTRIYDTNGRLMLTDNTAGDTADVSGNSLQPGIYIINVNNTLSRRVAVK